MRGFVLMVCVFFIAIGAGLFAFGSHLEPRGNLADPATLAHSMGPLRDEHHMTAAISCGTGFGFMILGILGILIPWARGIEFRQIVEMSEHSARAIAAVAIWLSIGLILTFGVFRLNWTGAAAMSVMFALVMLAFVAATICTAIVCGWKPWAQTNPGPTETAQRPA